jgi:hypothetical protein
LPEQRVIISTTYIFILVGRAFLGIAISALMTGFIVVLGDLLMVKSETNLLVFKEHNEFRWCYLFATWWIAC